MSAATPLFAALERSRALNKGSEQARYAQFATVSTDGKPECRTIVIRDITAAAIVATTDTRSQKVRELQQSPVCELCWWLPQTKEQYRIQSSVEVIDAAATDAAMLSLRAAVWQSMPAPSRTQFEQAAPGSVKAAAAKVGDLDRYESQPPSTDQPSPNFALLLMTPVRADYLYLPKPAVSPHPVPIEDFAKERGVQMSERTAESQARWVLEYDGHQWTVTEVHP